VKEEGEGGRRRRKKESEGEINGKIQDKEKIVAIPNNIFFASGVSDKTKFVFFM
jgi:hypothetical protein